MIQINDHLDIRIDKQGIWYFHGEEMKRQDIVQYFYQCLKMGKAGNYLIETENDFCYVNVEDVPYIIKSVVMSFSQYDGKPCIAIFLTDGSNEELNLDNPFWTGEDNIMYCKVRRGEYAVRFSRPAYYQLCEYINYDSTRGKYLITLNNRSYPLILIDQP
jgi:hypothetical protein